jgi:hypothetical protein
MHPTLDLGLSDFLTPHMEDTLRPERFLKFSLLAFPDDSLHLLGLYVLIQPPFLDSRFVLPWSDGMISLCRDYTIDHEYALRKKLEFDRHVNS